jgi:chemotaxis protein MotB
MQTNLHQKLVEEFDITKIKIKNLTGIKIQVISKLREKLGKSINMDEKSGAIQFSSNILFDQGEFKLKEESKQKLSVILKKYLHTLLEDDSIKKNIHSITIEGHTNSDGTYLNNLQLSQKRALEVMQFLYSSNIIDKKLLREYVNSSGKSFSDIVYKDGVEDKDNSRRIEIKFRIKNESAIKELQKFLGNEK